MSISQDTEVTIIIPHYNGESILEDCLNSIAKNTEIAVHTILIDNGSTDNSIPMVKEQFPFVEIKQMAENLGFAGGCNAGIEAAETPYVLILNNDTIHKKGWVRELLNRLKSAPDIAAVQPKLLSFQNEGQFDYSGAAGGEIDIFGFPFARGRLFDHIETDDNQYQEGKDIFWASGTAFLARRKLLLQAGLFDDDFFAHMEEIDLDWRLQLMGYRIVVEPQSVIWHRSGYTLGAETFFKKYLNHRNSLYMFLSNFKIFTMAYLVILRFGLDWLSILGSLFKGDLKRSAAVIKAHFWILTHPARIIKKRKRVKKLRKVGDYQMMQKMYFGSVALMYYLFGKKKYTSLK